MEGQGREWEPSNLTRTTVGGAAAPAAGLFVRLHSATELWGQGAGPGFTAALDCRTDRMSAFQHRTLGRLGPRAQEMETERKLDQVTHKAQINQSIINLM